MEQTYDVNYFIKKFSAIPEKKWTAGKFVTKSGRWPFRTSQMCAQGHCFSPFLLKSSLESNGGISKKVLEEVVFHGSGGEEWAALVELFGGKTINGQEVHYSSVVVPDINNGKDPRYQQPTPKQRILAALYDIKSIQEKQTNVNEQPKTQPTKEVKERVRVERVAVPTSVSEQSKELILN